jgi:hypothetical protein
LRENRERKNKKQKEREREYPYGDVIYVRKAQGKPMRPGIEKGCPYNITQISGQIVALYTIRSISRIPQGQNRSVGINDMTARSIWMPSPSRGENIRKGESGYVRGTGGN